jgi:hypothetical protein
MNAKIEAAIEDLYAAFARPTPRKVEGCSCCTTEEELRTLVETPLRQLTIDQLGSYAFSVMLTVGDEDDLRYFWPRIVELAAEGERYPDLEVVFAKPKLAEWRRWPPREQAATERFVEAVMEDMAETEHDPSEVDAWVCAFGRLLEDGLPSRLAPLLRDTPAAGANLSGLHSLNLADMAKGELHNAFWSDAPGPAAELVSWLRSDAVAEALARHGA